jgi:hypothetical protein
MRFNNALIGSLLGSMIFAANFVAAAEDNPRLAAIYKEDQKARQKQPIDWSAVSKKDKAHRAEVLDLLKSGKVITANDYYYAAMVYQHGDEVDDIRVAFSLAQISSTIDPTQKKARWLSAAAWDRIMLRKDVPQWYGTQYCRPVPGGPMELYKVDESLVTDEERTSMGVPTLQEAKDRLQWMNK